MAPVFLRPKVPLDHMERLVRESIGEPARATVAQLDEYFENIDQPSKFRKLFPAGTSVNDLEAEIKSMSWNPKPPAPNHEEVLCYVVGWESLFVYVGEDGRITRVWRSST